MTDHCIASIKVARKPIFSYKARNQHEWTSENLFISTGEHAIFQV